MSKFEDKEIRTPSDLAGVNARNKRTPEEMRALFHRVSAVMADREPVTSATEPTHEDMQRGMAEHSAKWRENRAMREARRESEHLSPDSVTDANVVPFARAGSQSPQSHIPSERAEDKLVYQLAAGESETSQESVLSRANIRLIFSDSHVEVFCNQNLSSGVFIQVIDLLPGCKKIMVGNYRFRIKEWDDDPTFAIISGLTLETLCKLVAEDENGQRKIKAQSLD